MSDPRFALPDPSPGVPHVKVCGIARAEDALLALECGATFLGLIFAAESPRRVDGPHALEIVEAVRPRFPAARFVGVFVHETPAAIASLAGELGLFAAQLHREVTDADRASIPVPIWQAIRVRGPESIPAASEALGRGPVVLDAYAEGKHGGTGKTFDHALAAPLLAAGPVFIAGGLNPANIGALAGALARGEHAPYAFDVSSGLEASPGVKDPDKVRAFFAELERGWAGC